MAHLPPPKLRSLLTRLASLGVLALPAAGLFAEVKEPVKEPEKEQEKAAAEPAAPGATARLPVRVIAGRLVARCEVSTKVRRIPANLFIDVDRGCGLELHNKAADGIKVDIQGGIPITIHMSGFDITVPRREHGDEDLLDEFTRLYSKELGETACVGAIGLNILRDHHLVFDLNAGFLYLEQPHPKLDTPPPEIEGTVVNSITVTNDQVWVPVRLADDRVMVMNLGTSRYDTLVDENLCEALDKPAGDIGRVQLKSLRFDRYVAMRPAELALVHPDGVLGTIGLNLLAHFRVTVDRVNRFVRFEPTVEPRFPTADVAYFKAMVGEDPEALRACLEANPDSRLAREAAAMLLGLLVDSGAPAEKFESALQWMDKTRIPDLRSTEALATMKTLLEARRPEVAIRAGEIGVESGRKDRYPESVHRLHAKLGELMLDHGTADAAWEHLLSAAFGLPDDGRINLDLGRFYERQGRFKRAMSRYVQAVIQPESGAPAIAGLERVQKAMGGEPLSVDLVDKLIAGKVYNFGAATTFEADAKTDNNRVVLVELFTNPHLGRRLQEGWVSFNVGGVMGQEGLLSHFPRKRVAVITYHVAEPEPSAMMNALSMDAADLYGDTRPVYTVINGTTKGPGAGRSRDAEKIFEENRRAVLAALAEPTEYLLEASARIEKTAEGTFVKGSVDIDGPQNPSIRVQVVLVERGVLYPGKGKVVVHRMVARGVLTPSLAGVAFEPEKGAARGRMTLPFKQSLEALTAANEAWLERYEKRTNKTTTRLSTRIDPRQVSVVAFLRDTRNQEVLQAVQVDAETGEKTGGGPR